MKRSALYGVPAFVLLVFSCRLPPVDASLFESRTENPDTGDSTIPPGGALVGSWKFPTVFSSPIADLSGNGNDLEAILGNPTTQSLDGRIGLEFAATTDQLQAGPSASLTTPIGGQSLSFWYYGNAFVQGSLISRYNTFGGVIWRVGSNVAGQLNVLDLGGYVGGSIQHFGVAFAAGTWNHLAAVFDVDAGEVRVFANGGSPAVRLLVTGGFTDASSILVGDVPGGSTSENAPLGPNIADIRLYNYALSAQQVTEIYSGL